MRVVVGLGNPGERYRRTRHNVGYMVVDALQTRAQTTVAAMQPFAWSCRAQLSGQEVVLAKPLTFMNRSGVAVERLLADVGASPRDLVVVVDDLALELGQLRVRERGSHGGHNGLRSLIDMLATEEFPRVRVGIRRGDLPEDLAAYVLSDFAADDVLVVQEVVGWAADAVACVLVEGAGAAMNRFNGPRQA